MKNTPGSALPRLDLPPTHPPKILPAPPVPSSASQRTSFHIPGSTTANTGPKFIHAQPPLCFDSVSFHTSRDHSRGRNGG